VRVAQRSLLTIVLLLGATAASVLLLVLALAPILLSSAQAPETMMPEQSAAKAKALLQQAITALGGQAYLSVRNSECTGRGALFGHSGDLTGYTFFHEYTKLPDKDRTEYAKKGNIIDVYNGNQGWSLDRGGVQEASASAIEDYQAGLKKDIDQLLRFRLNEEGMNFRYGGSDIVDLKQVEWVEVVDRDRRTFRIALDSSTHLPIRVVVTTRNPTTRERDEEITYFSNYHSEQGVQTPFQVTRERNGFKVYQVFLTGCQYNTGLTDELFTRASLEKRFSETKKKKK
jgi:outer membrane lipoprotein-sorting protein